MKTRNKGSPEKTLKEKTTDFLNKPNIKKAFKKLSLEFENVVDFHTGEYLSKEDFLKTEKTKQHGIQEKNNSKKIEWKNRFRKK